MPIPPWISGLRRLTAGPVVLRSVVLALGVLELLVAMPAALRAAPAAVVLAVLCALAAGAWPGSGWVAGVQGATVVAFLASTVLYAQPVPLALVLVLAAALYGQHTAAALAAAVPPGAALPSSALLAWLGRTGAVLAVALGLAAALTALPSVPAGGTAALPVAGLLAAVGAGALLVYLLRRRQRRERGG